MAPTRVGIIGLSPNGPGGWAVGTHLPFIQASPDYEIVAVCNSTKESSENAIKVLELPSTTRAYGNPEDIANDPDVDLVVSATRVDKHFATISPALRAGKNVHVEWPLGANLGEAKELLRLQKEGGGKIASVGLQGRQSPVINKVKALIEAGAIGKVLSSTFVGQGGSSGEYIEQRLEYFAHKSIGGNLVTIRFAHLIDYFQYVLGYGFEEQHSLFANTRPEIKYQTEEGAPLGTYKKDADDHMFVIGTLKSGVKVSFALRGGTPFKGAPGLDWRIYGQTGEINITADGPFLPAGEENTVIKIQDFEKGTVEVVEVEKDEVDALGLHWVVGNVGRIYADLKKGKVTCSFEDAVERHAFIAQLYKENGYLDG